MRRSYQNVAFYNVNNRFVITQGGWEFPAVDPINLLLGDKNETSLFDTGTLYPNCRIR